MPAESPAGHVPLRLVMQHALWDSWVHERDILLPLERSAAVEVDELRACLQYAAALSPALAIGLGQEPRGSFAVRATDPEMSFVLDVDGSVTLWEGEGEGEGEGEVRVGVPCLQGSAVELVEALSIRGPMPTTAPPEWRELVVGLATAFDSELS
jgi:hypothetical protein